MTDRVAPHKRIGETAFVEAVPTSPAARRCAGCSSSSGGGGDGAGVKAGFDVRFSRS